MATFMQALRAMGSRLAGRRPAQQLRRFDAAVVNRLTESWLASSKTIDDELRGDLDRLRRRSRDLAKNNEYMAKFLRMVRNNVVGQGMTLQSRPMDGQAIDRLAAAAVERHFAEWCKPANCDVAGRAGFWTQMRSACDALARDGELLLRLRPGMGLYGLQLQLLDVERIDTQYNEARAGTSNAIIMGVEVDADHRPVAYHLLRQRPGTATGMAVRGERDRIPAAELLHVFLPMEPEQTRGVPWAHAAMRRLNDLGGYREAAVIAARIGASKMGFFTSPEPDQVPQDGKDAQGVPYANATPGEFGVLPPGVGFQAFDPAYPHEQFGDFTKATLRGIASAMGVSYPSLSNDLESVNFSSIRSGVLEERDEWMVLQDFIIEQLVDPVFDQWLRLALAAGAITQVSKNGPSALPMAKREKFAQRLWMPRRWGWVDPLKDVQATALAIQNNLTTATDAAARAGVDIEDVFATKQREEQLAAEYGVTMQPASTNKPKAKPQGEPDAAQKVAKALRDMAERQEATAQQLQQALQLIAAARADAQPVTIHVPTPVVNVAAPQVTVQVPEAPAPVVNVAVPEQAAPVVHVAAPQVTVQPAQVDVTVEALMPPASVVVELPRRVSETQISRDSSGRITNTVTTERDAA